MKKNIVFVGTIALAMTCATMNAQVTVGAGTMPEATLDVVTSSLDAEIPEGVIAPRLSGDQIQAKDNAYGSDQTGAIVYATAKVTTASTKTANITAAGYYYFDGNVWQTMQGGTEWYVAGTANDAQANKTGEISHNGRMSLYTAGPNPTTTAARPNQAFTIINDGGTDGEDDLAISTYSGDAATSSTPALFLYRSRGTRTAPQPLQKGDIMGSFKFGAGNSTGGTIQSSGFVANYQGDGTNNKSDLALQTGNTTRMLIDENGNVGVSTNTPVAKLDINAGTAPGFRLDDGTPTNDAGKVLTSDANGVGTWATMFPNFQTAQVVFSSATRTFGTGNNATAQTNAHNVGVGTASLAAGSTVPRFAVDNSSGIFIVPKGKYFVYFSGDISSAEYAYEMLRRVNDNAALLTTIVSERADNFTMMSVDADTQMYLAVGGIVGSNPAPEYYLTQDRYEAGLNSSFQITFMKYAE